MVLFIFSLSRFLLCNSKLAISVDRFYQRLPKLRPSRQTNLMMYRWYLPETTKAIWEMWERTGAKEVSDTQEAHGFMQNTAPDVLVKYEPLEGCECDKKARVLQIKRLLNLEPTHQESIESRIQITSRYTDLEQLLGLNPDTPKPPVVWDIIVPNPPFSEN